MGTNHSSGALRVLVVDDDPDTVGSIALLLRLRGYDVRAAGGGEAALTSAQADWPDVVLLDLAMPHMDGYEVARRLRGLAVNKAVPFIIAVSGWQETDGPRLEAEEISLRFRKPLNPELLCDLLETLAAREGRE